MNERGIIFQADMVRAILEGRKTQTRRVVKLRRGGVTFTYPGNRFVVRSRTRHVLTLENAVCVHEIDAPYRTGDRLWVRETFANIGLKGYPPTWFYRADGDELPPFDGRCEDNKWRPSIHMPRWASRIDLETCVSRTAHRFDLRVFFRDLWNSIHGPDAWDQNPWVWVIEFERVR